MFVLSKSNVEFNIKVSPTLFPADSEKCFMRFELYAFNKLVGQLVELPALMNLACQECFTNPTLSFAVNELSLEFRLPQQLKDFDLVLSIATQDENLELCLFDPHTTW